MEDFLLDNKGPIAWEQIGKTPSWKRTRYVKVSLIDITMGKKRIVKPNGVQVVTGKGIEWGIGKQMLYQRVWRDNQC